MTSEASEPKTERVPFMASAALVADLDAAAKHRGISRSELIRRTLERDDHIGRDSRRWQSRQGSITEERDDSRPESVPVVGAAYGPEPRAPFAFAGHVHQAECAITPELAAAISGTKTEIEPGLAREWIVDF